MGYIRKTLLIKPYKGGFAGTVFYYRGLLRKKFR